MTPRNRPVESDPRYCPECGQQIHAGKEAGHAEDHWPKDTPPNRMSAGAIKRRDIVLAGGLAEGETE